MSFAARLISFVRDADWLDEKRVRAYSLILATVSAVGFVAWIVLAPHLIDRAGKPLGPDFMSFYAASKLALAGHAAGAWSPVAHQAAENGIFGRSLGYWAFFYPPAYLLLCWPLALLPYGIALGAWLGGTTAAAVALLRRWAKDVPWIVVLAFPALWLNLGNGQNAALFTALLAGGCLLLPRRPILAGLVFGLLVMKPQLALALPVLLAASGRWKTFAATGLSAAILSVLAWLAVGTEGYLAFWHNGALATATLDQGLVSPDKMQSVFAALRLLGAPSAIALCVQVLVAFAVLASAAWMTWRHKPEASALCALVVAATLPLSPFLLDYDLMLLAIPLGWLAMRGLRDGFLPWEKAAILVVFVWPLFARAVAANLHLPLTPLLLLGVYGLVARRVAPPVTRPSRTAMALLSILGFFRDAAWLTAERTRVYSLMILCALASAAVWIVVSQSLVYHATYTQGGDFVSFYAAAKLAVGGHAADAWHRAVHARMEGLIAPGQGYLAFFYPPAYLLLLWPLGWLPYGAAVLVWLTLTNGVAIFALYRLLKALAPNVRPAIIPLLAFPALWINLGCGQNGALTLGILAGGALWLDRRPWLAGAILGLMVVKPQLAIVLPLALLIYGRWKPLLAMGAGAAMLSGLAYLAVGTSGYTAFFQASHDATQALVHSLVDPVQMQSLYAALKLLKAPIATAFIAQTLLSLLALGLTAYAVRAYRPDGFACLALCVSATVLATPFLLDYDLAVTALPIAWLLASGARDGRRPWETLIALGAALMPLLSRQVALHLAVPLAPPILMLLFAAVFARVRAYSIYSGAAMRLPSSMASDTIRSGEKSASEALARTNSRKCA